MHILTNEFEIKLVDANSLLFDIQTALLNSGICEKGIDDIKCNAAAVCILEEDAEHSVHLALNQALVSTDAYGNVAQLSSLGIVEDFKHYVESIAEHASSLFAAAEKEDYEWTWKNIMSKDIQHVSSLDYGKPVKVCFKELNFLGRYADDGVFFCNDGKLVIMKKQKVNRLLLLRFM